MESPGDTPRKGPLLAQKLAGKGGATAGAAASVPSTPGGSSSVQLAGHSAGADPEVSAPGKFSGKNCSCKKFAVGKKRGVVIVFRFFFWSYYTIKRCFSCLFGAFITPFRPVACSVGASHCSTE